MQAALVRWKEINGQRGVEIVREKEELPEGFVETGLWILIAAFETGQFVFERSSDGLYLFEKGDLPPVLAELLTEIVKQERSEDLSFEF